MLVRYAAAAVMLAAFAIWLSGGLVEPTPKPSPIPPNACACPAGSKAMEGRHGSDGCWVHCVPDDRADSSLGISTPTLPGVPQCSTSDDGTTLCVRWSHPR
jgi:hypothetical protein